MKQVFQTLLALSRFQKISLKILVDLISVFIALSVSYYVHNLDYLSENIAGFAAFAVLLSVMFIGWHFVLRTYYSMTRYTDDSIIFSTLFGSLFAAGFIYLFANFFGFPQSRGVPTVFAGQLFLLTTTSRFMVKNLFLWASGREGASNIIIYGAGAAGRQLVKSLQNSAEYRVVALVDDDRDLNGLTVHGLKVYHPQEIENLILSSNASEILIAIPSLSRSQRRSIVNKLSGYDLVFRTIPGLTEIVSGSAKVTDVRKIAPEDLLGRDPVQPIPSLFQQLITGKVVMVTGAGGSIGSELCRQIMSANPGKLVLFDCSEFNLYSIQAELQALVNDPVTLVPVLGTVQDQSKFQSILNEFGVETLYHAAAYKHVPLVEHNVVQGLLNNALGTFRVANAILSSSVQNAILISTDKAVRPTNVMGATKRLAELVFQAAAQSSTAVRFSMVRFGNVLGSSGSVIPRFQAQIDEGGPVTVTHREINRYFMTIPEAAQLVIQAGTLAEGGDVFVLDMGQPVKIVDLAKTMIRQAGFIPYLADDTEPTVERTGQIAVQITGLRPGEKLYEELLIGDSPYPTMHPRIMKTTETSISPADLNEAMDRLTRLCDAGDVGAIRQLLCDLPLNYSPVAKF